MSESHLLQSTVSPSLVGRGFFQADLLQIATLQKGVLVCLVVNLFILLLSFAILYVPIYLRPLVVILSMGNTLVAVMFVCLLSICFSGLSRSIVYGVLTVLPLFSLIVLVVVNRKATKALKESGVKVGLMGANISAIKSISK